MGFVVMVSTESSLAFVSAAAPPRPFAISEPLVAGQLSLSKIQFFRDRILHDRPVGSGGLLEAAKEKCRLWGN